MAGLTEERRDEYRNENTEFCACGSLRLEKSSQPSQMKWDFQDKICLGRKGCLVSQRRRASSLFLNRLLLSSAHTEIHSMHIKLINQCPKSYSREKVTSTDNNWKNTGIVSGQGRWHMLMTEGCGGTYHEVGSETGSSWGRIRPEKECTLFPLRLALIADNPVGYELDVWAQRLGSEISYEPSYK